jgi:hypothetical protein
MSAIGKTSASSGDARLGYAVVSVHVVLKVAS